MIVIESTVLYWYRCASCGYASGDYDDDREAERAADRHVCPTPPTPLFELDEAER